MDGRMEYAHVKAGRDASKVLQAFFALFVVVLLAFFAIKMLSHTDGVLITEDADNEACWTSSKDIINKNQEVKAVKCKEQPATKQSATDESTNKSTNSIKNKAKKTSTKK